MASVIAKARSSGTSGRSGIASRAAPSNAVAVRPTISSAAVFRTARLQNTLVRARVSRESALQAAKCYRLLVAVKSSRTLV
jgi:hypothetical protein